MEHVFSKRSVKAIIFLVCLLSLAQSSLATTVRVPSDADMVVGARAIVRGKVLSVVSAIDENDNRIYTYITVRVNEVLKGEITTRRIVLKEMGGTVGDRITVLFGNPKFTRGEKVILYLDTWKDGSLRTYQMFLGKFNITRDPDTGEEIAVRSEADEDTTILAQSTDHGGGGASTGRMELSSYLRMVQEKVVTNLEASRTFEETYYRDVPTLARPAEYSRLANDQTIEPQFALFNPAVRWPQSDTGQSVPYTLNPNASGEAGVPALVVSASDIAAAAASWSNVSGSGLRLSYAGPLNQCYLQTGTPGINIVSNNCDGRNSPSPGCAGILAWGGYSGARFAPKVVNGVTFQYEITQGFVSCNPWAACNFGDHCSVQFIVTHEMGHALGFGHSAIPQATMYAFAQAIARCAVLHADDEAAARAVYPVISGGGGPLSITTASPLANGTIGTAYSQTLLATGGSTPYTWSVVTVAGQSLPTGVTLSANGTLSGNPTAAGTSNFTVQVQDAANPAATVQKAFAITTSTASLPYDSQFLSQTVPNSLTPGQNFSVSMQWRNTGTQTWSGPNFYFVTQNPPFNTTWGGPGGFNAVSLQNFVIGPGQLLDATFTMIAPTTPGVYNFQWQIFQDFGVEFFGQMSANVAIGVGTPPPPPPPTIRPDTIGLYNPSGGAFFLRNSNTTGIANISFSYGPAGAGWIALVGDWNGDGVDTPGLYNPAAGSFFLRNSNSTGVSDVMFSYGPAGLGWVPLVGDWNGDGTDTVGLYNPAAGSFFLRNSNSSGVSDVMFSYGPGGLGWLPLVGDWDGNGTDTIGLYNPATGGFFLRNANSTGVADVTFSYGPGGLGWTPLVGDWNGDGVDTVGLYNPAAGGFFLRNANSTGVADVSFSYGPGGLGWVALAGDWDGL